MDVMTLWKQLARPPASALRPIQAGRLRGKSDINPQWRIQAITEHFGLCGIGWRFTVDELWTVPGNGVETFAFARISLYVKWDGEWSEAIPGIGGSKLVEAESRGPHNNDEAYKMAVTDALGTAMKRLGVAADIYMGLWDGSKYRDGKPPQGTPKRPPLQPFDSGPSIKDDLPQAEQIRLEAVLEDDGKASELFKKLDKAAKSPPNQRGKALADIEEHEEKIKEMDGNAKSALELVVHRARLRLLQAAMKGIVNEKQLTWARKMADNMDPVSQAELRKAADEAEKRQEAETNAPEGTPY